MNSDNKFVFHKRMQDSKISATKSQLRLVESKSHDLVFDIAEITNLHVFSLIYVDLIKRRCPKFSSFMPTAEHLTITIDAIRAKKENSRLPFE